MLLIFYTVADILEDNDTSTAMVVELVFQNTPWEKYDKNHSIYKYSGDIDSLLYFACDNSQKELYKWTVDQGARETDYAMLYVGRVGSKEMVEWLTEQCGQVGWNGLLIGACAKGHREIAELAFEHGADDFNQGILVAFYGDDQDFLEWLCHKKDVVTITK